MKGLGIETGADLRAKPLEFLRQHFGSSAEWYHAIARGIDHRPVNPNRERKSSGSETTFLQDLVDPSEIEAGVLRMADDVWAWCEKRQAFGRTTTVKVKYSDFQQITRRRSHADVIATHEDLRSVSLELIRSVLPTARPIRLVGVTVSNFVNSEEPATDNLFADQLTVACGGALTAIAAHRIQFIPLMVLFRKGWGVVRRSGALLERDWRMGAQRASKRRHTLTSDYYRSCAEPPMMLQHGPRLPITPRSPPSRCINIECAAELPRSHGQTLTSQPPTASDVLAR